MVSWAISYMYVLGGGGLLTFLLPSKGLGTRLGGYFNSDKCDVLLSTKHTFESVMYKKKLPFSNICDVQKLLFELKMYT